MRKALFLLLFLVPFASAQAQDFGCGRDTNRDSSVSNLCPGADQDADLYTVEQGDCDDTDWQIFPGVSTTKGCTSGQIRTCKADGTGYTACSGATFCPNTADTRMYPDEVAGGNCYYFSPTGDNATGTGTFANPWRDLRKISNGFAGRHTPMAGDKFILLGGSYSGSFGATNHFFAGASDDCTATQRCSIICRPGDACAFNFTGDANDYSKLNVFGDFWNIRGLEVLGGNGRGINATAGAKDIRISLNYVHDHDGTADNNLSGISFDQGADGRAHHNFVANICDAGAVGGCLNQNNFGIEVYRGATTIVEANIVNNSVTSFGGIRSKHADYNSVHVFRANYINNVERGGWFGSRNLTVENNLVLPTQQGLVYAEVGGTSYFGDATFRNNTIIIPSGGGVGVAMNPWRTYNANGTLAANSCSGNYIGPVTFSGNIVQSARVGIGTEQRLFAISIYGPDSLRQASVGAGLINLSGNCYHSTAAETTLFGEFENNNGDLTCSGRGSFGGSYTLATWQTASGTSPNNKPAFDSGSVVANPTLAANTHLPTANCLSHGYRNSWVTVGVNPGSGGSNATNRSWVNLFFRRRR